MMFSLVLGTGGGGGWWSLLERGGPYTIVLGSLTIVLIIVVRSALIPLVQALVPLVVNMRAMADAVTTSVTASAKMQEASRELVQEYDRILSARNRERERSVRDQADG